jgi:hypothetical protein
MSSTTGAGPSPTRQVTDQRWRPSARLWERPEYQRLWLQIEHHAWRTIALVPGEIGLPTYEVASLLTAIGAHYGTPIGVFDLRDVRLNRALAVIARACEEMRVGERILFATRTIRENLATIPVARASDGVILCVAIGSTPLRLVEETIEQVGRDRFLGSLVVRAPAQGPRASSPEDSRRRLEA